MGLATIVTPLDSTTLDTMIQAATRTLKNVDSGEQPALTTDTRFKDTGTVYHKLATKNYQITIVESIGESYYLLQNRYSFMTQGLSAWEWHEKLALELATHLNAMDTMTWVNDHTGKTHAMTNTQAWTEYKLNAGNSLAMIHNLTHTLKNQ